MYEKVNRISSIFTWSATILMFLGILLFNLTPSYTNYRNGVFSNDMKENFTLQFSLYYAYPGFDQEDHFIFATILNYWFSYISSVLICENDMFLCLMVFQIIGHIDILTTNLVNFPRPKKMTKIDNVVYKQHSNTIEVDLFDDQENEMIHTKIKECVDHHRLIVSFVNDVSNFYGPMIGTTYMYHLSSCCLLLLECSAGNIEALVRYGPLTVIIFGQLILLSVVFEIVATKTDGLSDAVYSLPWESMNTSNQRSVCILLHRMQIPSHITAMGMTTVGVQTMLAILKTTFSYFAFLRSF